MSPNGQAQIRVAGLRIGLLVAAVAVLCLTECGNLSEGPPTDVVLTAASDTTVRISWTAPAGGAPDSYVIAFMETGTSSWLDFGTATDSATKADHNPLGRTGRYRVTAIFGGRSYPTTEAPTSAPVHSDTIAVGELNSSSRSGYGWERDSGAGSVFTMGYASNADRVDFYITDWATGFAGPTYSMASPDWGPNDPGGAGVVPVGAWRATGFGLVLSGEQSPLPVFNSGSYSNNLELGPDSTLVAVCCTDTDTLGTRRHFALVKTSNRDLGTGTVQIESWFQPITGLRLIQH